MSVALVTGASSGIGEATALRLASAGYAVCVNYLENREGAESLVRQIGAKGGRALACQADVAQEDQIVAMFELVHGKFGPVTALVNNAAVSGSCGNGTITDLTKDVIERVLSVNIAGVFLCCREAVGHMRLTGGGAIVNVSSESARFGGKRNVAYAASKAAINTFTIGFAREVASFGIRVNAVSPGIIDTDFHTAGTTLLEDMKAVTSSIPFGRMGTPAEVAEAIFWLLSENSSYISGSVISIAGAR